MVVTILSAFLAFSEAINSRLMIDIPGLELGSDIDTPDLLESALTLPEIPGLTVINKPTGNAAYMLAMERPKQFSNELTLHGLWPQGGMSCGGEKFDASKLAPIRDEMDAYWYSYKDKSAKANEVFWDHEWTKHGTCYARDNKTTQLAYFQKSLTLLRDIGFYRCDQKQFCDCRCSLDINFKVIGECVQKGTSPPI